MIPMWMKMKIPKKGGRPFNLYLPIWIGWLLLLVLFLIILPFWLIASIVAVLAGYGWVGFRAVVLLFNTLWNLKGLEVDVESAKDKIYMKFI